MSTMCQAMLRNQGQRLDISTWKVQVYLKMSYLSREKVHLRGSTQSTLVRGGHGLRIYSFVTTEVTTYFAYS